MSILKVARIGHPAVRAQARDLTLDELRSAEMQKFIDDMVETMYEYEGVGLAAPQVHVSLRLAVLEVKPEDERGTGGVPLTVLVNPKVTPLGTKKAAAWEGCLSIPGLRGAVPRYERLRLEALDREGQPFALDAQDFHARVIQHECDHLDGGVYLDRMKDMRSLTFMDEFERYVLADHDDDEDEPPAE
jgi:peptide deformylase